MLIEETVMNVDEESEKDLRSLRITSLSDEEEMPNVDDNVNEISEGDDEDDDEEEVPVKLGFLEKPEHSWLLGRQYFPCKAGGVPAWLDPVTLPSGKACLCDMCGEPLQFVLQVYAPISEFEEDPTFHRTLYVFMCPSMTCLLRDQHEQWKHGAEKPSRSVKVFRCQLPRTNVFYAWESPRQDGTARPLCTGAPLCNWCGTWKGSKTCSSCRRARYCSEKHQAIHWRLGHKLECKRLTALSNGSCIDDGASSTEIAKVACKTLWPEYEIAVELESELSSSDADEQSSPLVPMQRTDETVKSMMDSFEGDGDKKSWATFQERLARAPEQVLRYSREERVEPLWPTSNGHPSRANVPDCSYCGGAMNFEFQILPQLLYYFGVKNDVNSLDWATIAVYTCTNSCDRNAPYKEEFVWVQLTSQNASGI